jgi:aspartate carbamoyltransferase catalytic subunit
VLDTADVMAEIVARRRPLSETLRGVGLTNLFYEATTRTRVSFEVAAKHLSADVVNVSVTGSSIEKGESLLDTMRTLESLGTPRARDPAPDLRRPVSGRAEFEARW